MNLPKDYDFDQGRDFCILLNFSVHLLLICHEKSRTVYGPRKYLVKSLWKVNNTKLSELYSSVFNITINIDCIIT